MLDTPILGRNVLAKGVLIYDGPNQEVTLELPDKVSP